MALKVCKFGGTSMADGNIIVEVKKIMESDKDRRFAVVSAPGKRYSGDVKVTDLLYSCQSELNETGGISKSFPAVRARFLDIARQLNLKTDIGAVLDETERRIVSENSTDFTASRGEYLSARVFAEVSGAKFIDSEEVIFFKADGTLDGAKTYKAISEAVDGVKLAVFPGFYGKGADGRVKTFSRGGSDITGAVVARAVNATLYENWTDVSGFLACDPHIVDFPPAGRGNDHCTDFPSYSVGRYGYGNSGQKKLYRHLHRKIAHERRNRLYKESAFRYRGRGRSRRAYSFGYRYNVACRVGRGVERR